jgi:hypothetical protein
MSYTTSEQAVVLYLNGQPVAAPGRSSISPAQVKITQAWLGRSQYPNDPYTNARMQDFRFYSGALR